MKQALAVVAILMVAYAGSRAASGLQEDDTPPVPPKPAARGPVPTVGPGQPGSLPPFAINDTGRQRIEDGIERQIRQQHEARESLGSAGADDR